jgi:hypothetical protein
LLAEVLASRIIAGFAAIAAFGSVSTWIFAAEARGPLPPGNYAASAPVVWSLTGSHAAANRRDAIARANVRLRNPDTVMFERSSEPRTAATNDSPLVCRFLSEEPTGTSAKFNCVLNGGAVIKVKYNRNPEIHAETAASTLLDALGFAADHVRIVPWLRCYGCPRYPFLAMQLLSLTRATDILAPHGYDHAYTDFERVAVEVRFDAPAIETDTAEGWAWFELPSHASRPDLDAFRLLAVFLAHWDNKAENQRLVCLDGSKPPSTQRCEQPLLMIQDLGATFGPTKANLAEWANRPLWADRTACLVSMRALPWKGATFPDARISEEGRAQLARQLAAISDEDVRRLFADARFHEFYSGTDEDKDLSAWTAAFRHRVDQIVHSGPCPAMPEHDSVD